MLSMTKCVPAVGSGLSPPCEGASVDASYSLPVKHHHLPSSDLSFLIILPLILAGAPKKQNGMERSPRNNYFSDKEVNWYKRGL